MPEARPGTAAEADLMRELARRFGGAHPFDRHFARWKVRLDPVYRGILRLGLLPERGTVADVGCGRGIALALCAAASGPGVDLFGVERNPRHAEAARRVLGDRARIVTGDAATVELPESDLVLLLDVLHYVDEVAQERILRSAVDALRPGGKLALREADASGGLRFTATALGERLAAIGRGEPGRRFRFRSTREWARLVSGPGVAVACVPMSEGTPFANDLVVATRG